MSTVTAPPEAAAEEEAGQGRRPRKALILALVLAVTLAAGWWFFLKPSGPTEPEPGEVLTLEPIQVNLADGHYLRIGVALQLTADAHGADGSKALDAVIDLFSGVDHAELVKQGRRHELQERLEERLDHDYHGDVMEVYFTEFVTQ